MCKYSHLESCSVHGILGQESSWTGVFPSHPMNEDCVDIDMGLLDRRQILLL